MARDELDVDEDLPNFFEALPIREATRMIAENEQMQEHYGFELIEADLINKMENVEWQENTIQGTPWYSLMSNPKYIEDFSYIGPHVKDRNKLLRDTDMDDANNYQ